MRSKLILEILEFKIAKQDTLTSLVSKSMKYRLLIAVSKKANSVLIMINNSAMTRK